MTQQTEKQTPPDLPAVLGISGVKESWSKFDQSVWALIIANAVPLFGCLFLGWDTGMILIIYWAENLVIGFYNVLKMMMIRGNGEPKFFMIPFFIVHFGGFCAVHGFFVYLLTFSGIASGIFSDSPNVDTAHLFDSAIDWPGPLVFVGMFVNLLGAIYLRLGGNLLVSVAALLISHGISFRQNFIGKGEYLTKSLPAQMFQPYGRIVILHIAIIFGAVPVLLLGSPLPLLLLLVLMKTVIDIGLHLVSHSSFSLTTLVKSRLEKKLKQIQERNQMK